MEKKGKDINSKESNVRIDEPTLDLKTTRESRGLTLKDLSFSTKVSYSNLKAVEELKFEALPEPIYARAFIGAYADALDIDAKEILSLYDAYLESLEPDQSGDELLARLAEKKRYAGLWTWLAIASGILVVLGFIFFSQWGKDNSREIPQQKFVENAGSDEEIQNVSGDGDELKSENITPDNNDKTPETHHPDVSVSTDLSDAQSITEKEPAIKESSQQGIDGGQANVKAVSDTTGENGDVIRSEPHTLVITASELTWIQIGKDEEPSFEVMLRPGDRITEYTSKRFELVIGNAAGIEVSFQGKQLGPLGKHGEVIHLTLPADR